MPGSPSKPGGPAKPCRLNGNVSAMREKNSQFMSVGGRDGRPLRTSQEPSETHPSAFKASWSSVALTSRRTLRPEHKEDMTTCADRCFLIVSINKKNCDFNKGKNS